MSVAEQGIKHSVLSCSGKITDEGCDRVKSADMIVLHQNRGAGFFGNITGSLQHDRSTRCFLANLNIVLQVRHHRHVLKHRGGM